MCDGALRSSTIWRSDDCCRVQTVCPSAQTRRLTLDVTTRVARIGQAEPHTWRASRGASYGSNPCRPQPAFRSRILVRTTMPSIDRANGAPCHKRPMLVISTVPQYQPACDHPRVAKRHYWGPTSAPTTEKLTAPSVLPAVRVGPVNVSQSGAKASGTEGRHSRNRHLHGAWERRGVGWFRRCKIISSRTGILPNIQRVERPHAVRSVDSRWQSI